MKRGGEVRYLQVVMSEGGPSLGDGLTKLAHRLGDLSRIIILFPVSHQSFQLSNERRMDEQIRSRGL